MLFIPSTLVHRVDNRAWMRQDAVVNLVNYMGRAMPVDNQLYDRLSHTWWEDAGFLNILQSALNPARVALLERELRSHFGTGQGLRVLDVGCGGGLLAEELANRGCSVTGVDPSEGSLAVARDHAARAGLQIEYQPAIAEALPLPDGAFDAVICCDVLEHVGGPGRPWPRPLAYCGPEACTCTTPSTARSAASCCSSSSSRNGRRRRSWSPTCTTTRCSSARKKMEEHLRAAVLNPGPIVGLAPTIPLPRAIALLRSRAKGQITYGDLGRGLRIDESRDTSALYAGTAAKSSPPARSTLHSGAPVAT
jgi:2-polyprenyl-6-hydroxyphenyl methylase/3-demethylubiquinone-9 3-methyltransferase